MLNFKTQFITKDKNTRLYNLPVPVIGLTGGIATGKSSVAKLLRDKNIAVLDADKLVKEVYQKKEVIDFCQKEFPTIFEDNNINFKKLRELVFTNNSNKEKIETIIYRYLPEAFLDNFKKLNNPNFIVYDVPLLFEKGLDKLVDLKVCVYSSKEIQINRLMIRDKIDKDLANKIISSQYSIEDKKNNSDYVINNESDPRSLEGVVDKFLENCFQ